MLPVTSQRPVHFTFLEAVGDGETERVKSMLEKNGKLLFSTDSPPEDFQEYTYIRPPKRQLLWGTGRNALHFALENNDNTMLKLLLSFKGIEALVNKGCGPFHKTPLHDTARQENPERTELLLKAGADPFIKDFPNNRTPFYDFVGGLQFENVALVIKHVKSKAIPKLNEFLLPFLHRDLIPIINEYYTSDLMDAINEGVRTRPTILSLMTGGLYRFSMEKELSKEFLEILKKIKKIFRLLMSNGGDLNAPILYPCYQLECERTPLDHLRKAIANHPEYADEFQEELPVANAKESTSEIAFKSKRRKLVSGYN